MVNGRDADAVEDTVAAITASGGWATRWWEQRTRRASPRRSSTTCTTDIRPIGHPDQLRRNRRTAGSSILNISPDEFDRLISAHLGTAFHTCRVAARVMAAQGHGAIINTSSVAFLGDYGGTGYPAGKGAVNALTMAIAAELKSSGVRANVVCPGAKTRLSTGADYEKHIEDLHRRGLLDDLTMRASLDSAPAEFVAPIYAYLASDLARDVTGQIFVAAGGFVGRFDKPTPRCWDIAITMTPHRGRWRTCTR